MVLKNHEISSYHNFLIVFKTRYFVISEVDATAKRAKVSDDLENSEDVEMKFY